MASSKSTSTPPQTTDGQYDYPGPLITEPLSGTHLQSFILLHGRGSNALSFAPVLLSTPISQSDILPTAFPNAKFIFPTASKRRVQRAKRIRSNQWFDIWQVTAPDQREGLQNEGLRQTSKFVHGLIKKEVQQVGAANVILIGLSQGCAASLIAHMLWEGEPIAAVVGMCGWLPFEARFREFFEDEKRKATGNGDDIFEEIHVEDEPRDTTGPRSVELTAAQRILVFLDEEIEFSAARRPDRSFLEGTPIFLGHGAKDEKVPIELGRGASEVLRSLKLDVEFHEYPGLGHWYSTEMLGDIVKFIKDHCQGWGTVNTALKGRRCCHIM